MINDNELKLFAKLPSFFSCNNKRLADYLVMSGSKLIRIDKENGSVEYIFEHDDSIDRNLESYEANFKRCMF